MELKDFLIEEKQKWLQMEKGSTGLVREIMAANIRFADAILIFLASKQTEEDMAKLKLTLQTKPLPLSDLKPRHDDMGLEEEIIRVAEILTPNTRLPMDNLPPEIPVSKVVGKVYAMRKAGKLPETIWPAKRTKMVDGKKVETVDITRRGA